MIFFKVICPECFRANGRLASGSLYCRPPALFFLGAAGRPGRPDASRDAGFKLLDNAFHGKACVAKVGGNAGKTLD
jgi:hypothetical protein